MLLDTLYNIVTFIGQLFLKKESRRVTMTESRFHPDQAKSAGDLTPHKRRNVNGPPRGGWSVLPRRKFVLAGEPEFRGSSGASVWVWECKSDSSRARQVRDVRRPSSAESLDPSVYLISSYVGETLYRTMTLVLE